MFCKPTAGPVTGRARLLVGWDGGDAVSLDPPEHTRAVQAGHG